MTRKLKLPKPGKFVEPSQDLADYSIAIFGPKSAGKTLLASSFPDTINFRFERHRSNARIYQYPQSADDPPLTWEGMKDLVDQVIDQGKIKRIVIDSIDEAWTCCKREVLQNKFDVESVDELDDSYKAHQATQAEWASVFDTIRDNGVALTWLSHSKERKMKDPMRKLKAFSCLDMSCEPSAATIVRQRCDLVWFLMRYNDTRLLSFRTQEASEIVSQVRGHLLTPKGLLLYQAEVPNVPTDDDPKLYQFVEDAWNNKLENYDEDLNEPQDDDEEEDDTDEKPKQSLLKRQSKTKTKTTKKRSLLK